MKTLSNSAFTVLLLTALVIPPFVRAASIVPIYQYPEVEVKNSCGGVFYPSKGNAGVYGCAYLDGKGHGIVCGGSGKYAQTCTIYTAPFPKLPTQAQAGTAKPIVDNGSRNPAQPK
jgi:hypothetical protein